MSRTARTAIASLLALAARFPADLGPAFVDVSRYPLEQRLNYEIHAEKCSTCHSLARSVNSPLVSREDWTRFVSRMHGKAERTKAYGGPLLTEGEARGAAPYVGDRP